MAFFIFLCVLDFFSDSFQIAQHFNGVLENTHGGFPMINDFHRHFRNFVAKLAGEKYRLKVEREAVHRTSGKNVLRRLAVERLAAALGVGKFESAHEAKYFYIKL